MSSIFGSTISKGMNLLSKATFNSTDDRSIADMSKGKLQATVHTFDKPVSEQAKAKALMAMIRAMSVAPSLPDWLIMTYILSGTVLLHPEYLTKLQGHSLLSLKEVKSEFDLDNFHPAVFKSPKKAGKEPVSSQPGEPHAVGFFQSELDLNLDGIDLVAAAARWGVEMFPIGKNVSTANMSAFTEKRSKAIIGKYNFVDANARVFEAPFEPTEKVLKAISVVYSKHPMFRKVMGELFVDNAFGTADSLTAAFNMTFRLCDGYGFSGPGLIVDFLVALPSAADHPALRPEVLKFLHALDVYQQVPAARRGFLKVIYGEDYSLFRQSSRGILLATAAKYLSRTHTTLKSYGSFTTYDSQVAEILADLEGKTETVVPGPSNV